MFSLGAVVSYLKPGNSLIICSQGLPTKDKSWETNARIGCKAFLSFQVLIRLLMKIKTITICIYIYIYIYIYHANVALFLWTTPD